MHTLLRKKQESARLLTSGGNCRPTPRGCSDGANRRGVARTELYCRRSKGSRLGVSPACPSPAPGASDPRDSSAHTQISAASGAVHSARSRGLVSRVGNSRPSALRYHSARDYERQCARARCLGLSPRRPRHSQTLSRGRKAEICALARKATPLFLLHDPESIRGSSRGGVGAVQSWRES